MSKRYMLTAKAVINGAVHGPGYVFTLADGVKGPCKTVGFGPMGGDIPLYVDAPDLPDPVVVYETGGTSAAPITTSAVLPEIIPSTPVIVDPLPPGTK